jgi:hypothetical protein
LPEETIMDAKRPSDSGLATERDGFAYADVASG